MVAAGRGEGQLRLGEVGGRGHGQVQRLAGLPGAEGGDGAAAGGEVCALLGRFVVEAGIFGPFVGTFMAAVAVAAVELVPDAEERRRVRVRCDVYLWHFGFLYHLLGIHEFSEGWRGVRYVSSSFLHSYIFTY